MKKFLVCLLTLIFIFSAHSSLAVIMVNSSNVYGIVTDSVSKEPIQDVSVMFLYPPSVISYNKTNTDNNGYYFYEFYYMPKPTIDVIFRKKGFKDKKLTNILQYGLSDININVELEKDKNPVIIIPGIMGSYLNEKDSGDEVWPNVTKMFLSYNDSYLDNLILPIDGVPDNGDVTSGNIIRKISDNDFFDGLIKELEGNGYKEGIDLFVLSYDWRRNINYSAGGEATIDKNTLISKISEVLSKTGAEKVDLVAHSMGGLVVKQYMKEFGTEKIGKFIDVATPHLGAPKAAKILMYGDNMDIAYLDSYILNQNRVKIISQNMSSVYELLPSQKYFDEADSNYNSYFSDIFDIDNNGITGNLNFTDSVQLLANSGRNGDLLVKSDILHKNIDNYSPIDNGVDTYNIVGCGKPTLGKIYLLNKEKSGGNEYGLKYISGDGTVPVRSAEYLQTNNEFYVKNKTHATISSTNEVKKLVSSILLNSLTKFNFDDYDNLSQNKDNDFCALNGTQVEYHSPIDLHIYDENNNHVGPMENGDIENNIPGVEYDIIDNNKFAFLPDGKTYRVEGVATESDTFNARIQRINNNEYIREAYFNEIILNSTSTKIYFDIDSQLDYNQLLINIDKDGDSIFEQEILPHSILTGDEINDLKKPETLLNIMGNKDDSASEYYLDSLILQLDASDNIDGSGILKTEYSLDDGMSWSVYDEPIILNIPRLSTSTEAIYNLKYSSTDRAGNRENEKKIILKIKKMITIDSLINDINTLYDLGEINKLLVKNNLIKSLERINHYIDINMKKHKVLEKDCRAVNDKLKCEEKINTFNQRLDVKQEKKINDKFQNLLNNLDFYYNKQWINYDGYSIIKMELNHLMN